MVDSPTIDLNNDENEIMTTEMASQRKTELTSSNLSHASPTPRRRSRKRDAIILAAKDMFFLEGYAGASMDRITARAGVSKATIYSHFRSKEELLLAVVEAVVLPIQSDYRTALDTSAAFEPWLLALGSLLVRKVLLSDVTALERLVIAEALRFPELGRIFKSIAVDASLRVLRPRIVRAITEGDMRPCEPMIALQHFAEMCVGGLRYRKLLNEGEQLSEAEIARHVEDIVAVFLHGYGAPSA
jgi:TetR/AcrR family transcriptional regulator, mexJK operon transcriptional repressor